MFVNETVIVQSLDEIRQCLAGRERVVLRSAPGFAAFGGAGLWRAMVAAAAAEFPGRIVADILDCGGHAGYAMAALRAGCRHVALASDCAGFAAVAGAAGAVGAVVLAEPPA